MTDEREIKLEPPGYGSPLSQRELACLKLYAQGNTIEQVGLTLRISQSTVRFHLDNVRNKLGASNKNAAIHLATKAHLI